MAEIQTPALKDKLWHRLRADLARVAPNLSSDDRLICCCCGRLLPREAFSLEHIIPQQALADDPPAAKAAVPRLERSGYTLLCNAPLRINRVKVSSSGCNSWKGQHYDKALRRIFNSTALGNAARNDGDALVSAFAAAYLALFSEFGYQIVLTSSGRLCRRQFFHPGGFLAQVPVMSQVILTAGMPSFQADAPRPYRSPFSFGFRQEGKCTVAVRNYSVNLPISRDPRVPIASALPFVPSKYKMRPDFRAFFQ